MNNNLLSNSEPTQNLNMYYIYGGIAALLIVLVAVGSFLTYSHWHASPWYSDRAAAYQNMWTWWNPPSSALHTSGSLQQVSTEILQPAAPATSSTSERHPEGPSESWCFVGEDLTGRYCLKVPSDVSCDAERLFRTRRDCELLPANKLTAGIVTRNGTDMKPLSSLMLS